jgi:hypothetical protein
MHPLLSEHTKDIGDKVSRELNFKLLFALLLYEQISISETKLERGV